MEDGMAAEPAALFILARHEDVWLQVLTRLPLKSLTALALSCKELHASCPFSDPESSLWQAKVKTLAPGSACSRLYWRANRQKLGSFLSLLQETQPAASQKANESWLDCLKSVLLLDGSTSNLVPLLDGSATPLDWTLKDDVREAALHEIEFCCATLVAAELGIPFRSPRALPPTGNGTAQVPGAASWGSPPAQKSAIAHGDDRQDLVDVIAWAYSLAHAVSVHQREGQQRLNEMFIRITDVYVPPGLALLLTGRDPPANRAAAEAILHSVRAHACALGCALSAVFSYLDVNGGSDLCSLPPGLFPLFSALLTEGFPHLALARGLVCVADPVGADDGRPTLREWAPGGTVTALVATVLQAVRRDLIHETSIGVTLSNAQPLLEFSRLFNKKVDALLGAARWAGASSAVRASSGAAERSSTAGTEDGLSGALPTAAHIRIWSDETQSFKRASLPGLCVHESAFLLQTQEAVRTSILASESSPSKARETQNSRVNVEGFDTLPPISVQIHFPSLALGSALRAFATYFTHRACAVDGSVPSTGEPTTRRKSLFGSNQERWVPYGHRNLANPREPFAALVRDTTIGRQKADECSSSEMVEKEDEHEHSYVLGMALNFFGVARMLRKDSRVLGTGFERPRGRQSRRSSENEPALELLLGVDRTSRANSRRTSGADR